MLGNSLGRQTAFSWLPEWLNYNELGFAWTLCGLFALAVGLFSDRWAHKLVTAAFVLTSTLAFFWAVLFFISFVLGLGTLTSVASYAFWALLIYHMGSWADAPDMTSLGGLGGGGDGHG